MLQTHSHDGETEQTQSTVKPKCIQTPSTYLTLSQFIHYSLENGNNKWILIMSDNFVMNSVE